MDCHTVAEQHHALTPAAPVLHRFWRRPVALRELRQRRVQQFLAWARVVSVMRWPPIISASSCRRSGPSMARTFVSVALLITSLRTVRWRSA